LTRAARRSLAAFVIATALAGCATAPSQPSSAPAFIADAPFTLDGRLSARREHDGVAASFTWTHAPPRDDLAVSTSLGQIVAEVRGDASAHRVSLTRSDGTTDEASDWSTLTSRALGFALPLEGLASWARGAPHERSPYTREADGAGRTSLLRQDGWEISYDYDGTSREPRRMRLTYPGLEVRIVADRWREP
jgi:outer membrane lipoprotein LolB